jgi:hypothetical protein
VQALILLLLKVPVAVVILPLLLLTLQPLPLLLRPLFLPTTSVPTLPMVAVLLLLQAEQDLILMHGLLRVEPMPMLAALLQVLIPLHPPM